MPIPLKNPSRRVDTGNMSDTVLSSTPDAAPSLGDAPRLGEAINPTLPTVPMAPSPAAAPSMPAPTTDAPPMPMVGATTVEGAPMLPDAAPVLPTAASATPPTPAMPTGPSLPDAAPVLTSDEAPVLPTPSAQANAPAGPNNDVDGEPRHPMAHLMPAKSGPSEASQRAAEIRAAQKAKSKKIKIGIAVGSLVFLGVVGPPVYKWTANAINEAGNTSTEDVAD